jgi:hypothetical protein
MSTPAGWYPDPADPGRTRWWDGTRWSEHTSPAATSAAPPVPPAAPAAPAVPRDGEYAPGHPAAVSGAPAAGSTPAYGAPAYAAAPSWPSAAPAVASGPSAPGADTNTLWIYLCILASTLPILTLFFIDWNGYLRAMVLLESGDAAASSQAAAALMQWTGGILAISLLSYLFIGLSIVFAWLDWRELKKRGVARPFHWAFGFLALVISIGVYIIGRTVVLKRETGSGLTALWVWLASIALSIAVSIFWFVGFWQQMMLIVPTYGS